MARKCPDGTSMTRPVGTSAICPGASLTSCDAARSNPAASSVAYVGRETVESSRLIFRRIAAAYAIVVCVLLAAPASAQSLSAKLPLSPAIHVGKLPNGITFYVRHNAQPAKRVSLRLAVKAGSIDEADDQRGLAHMLEHMAFNGTTHFKPGELVAYFESIGVSFGAHVNAYTSYDETVYMLDVPSDRAGALDHGLQAMADFAGGMSLTDAEIDKERGVVLEEWRQRLGVQSRLQGITDKAIYSNSTYGDYRRDLVRSLFESMLNARLGEIARRSDAPFLGASAGDDTLGQTVEAFGVSARVNEGGIPKGIEALEQELARVRQFGFGDAELERVKKATLASYERAYNERDKSESPGLASELVG